MAQVDINDEDEEPLRFGYLEDHDFNSHTKILAHSNSGLSDFRSISGQNRFKASMWKNYVNG